MQLRTHPLMCYRGIANWPPVWTRADADCRTGEIGVLRSVASDPSGNRVHLNVDIDDARYVGSLLFDDIVFCWVLQKVLNQHLGKPIKEIGGLDLSRVL